MKVLVTKQTNGSDAGSIKDILNRAVSCKFVICHTDDTYIVVVSPAQGGQYHSEIANDLLISGYGVLGGGIMYVNPPTIPMMYWGASTMVDAFEYDRPEDESLLDCIKEQLERELAS